MYLPQCWPDFVPIPTTGEEGYMSKAFEILINNLADSGITVGPHTPVKHDNYIRQGNYTATETKFITGIGGQAENYAVIY